MKIILHVIAGQIFGGVESFLVALAKSDAASRGVEHQYAICFEGRLSKELGEIGCNVNMLGPARFLNPVATSRAKKKLHSVVSQCRPDVIVFHMSWSQILFGREAGKKCPWVAHHHSPSSGSILDSLVSWTKPRRIISPSRHSSTAWSQKYQRPVEILNYPVRQDFTGPKSLGEKAESKAFFKLPLDKVAILQCSRIEKWKGHDILLNSLALMKDNRNWVMVFGGAPQKNEERHYYQELKDQSKCLNLEERIIWLGNVENVPKLMAGCDIYCQANRGPEGFSLAFLEASFSGLPIVTTDIGGASEIIESNGFLISKPDPVLYAEKLKLLVNDDKLRIRQSEAAFEIGRRKGDPLTQISKYERLCLKQGEE